MELQHEGHVLKDNPPRSRLYPPKQAKQLSYQTGRVAIYAFRIASLTKVLTWKAGCKDINFWYCLEFFDIS
jgi:hypothetical protein